jgi:hypothetical protein
MLHTVANFARATLVVAVSLVLATGVAYVAVPANETADEGPADPILWARRPIVRALKAAGVLKFDERFQNPYLPTPSERTEPVYRGLLWPVGYRITRQVTDHNGCGMRSIRLCYAIGRNRYVAAENERPGEVSGFVPLSARGYWTELTDDRGEVHSVTGRGDVDPFWRD